MGRLHVQLEVDPHFHGSESENESGHACMHGDMDVDEKVLSDPPPADIIVYICLVIVNRG
jgi:hypothetical protein